MFSYFAQATPDGITDYLFTQGVLGVIAVGLIMVVVYQQKKLDRKDEKIEALQQARLDDNKTHTADYRDMAKDNQDILQGNSQSNALLAAKIESVKGK